ncbi:AcrR family transcriptional regulator [Breznakia sp. PF5-3]|uniref:TetR/AcrR family transcriptional regulator n=1 Tax=unclassified Breznakia TaxID=2623764 RepID=UPI0024056EA6|nr:MULTISPECIES: TetR/AcrR family transcriptional regulator [unclassified Breznakia]MDF9824908.1 AcrR family transcriptional regulator [Breznakia sp. PM6-1]MDF9835593.1 AcrR family transcriptional regulator [Breznakia sp. PF5-3]MDF9837991.1 AcrR family transcriptional regulator [Breznakia sp. PFB2-8]MDF9859980.1 AcrR family transcriptional regulator [Breznakia sp. PH5-24]
MNGFEKRTEEKRQLILKTTFDMMNTDAGITNVRIDEIVKQAKVGKTTIFKYFGSKDNLIHQVFKEFIEQIATEARKIMDENKPFAETLIAMSQNKITFFREVNHQFYLDLMDYFTNKNDDGFTVLMMDYLHESSGLMLDLFHRGKKEGKVDLKYSDEFLLLYFQALVEGISNPKVYEHIVPYTAEWTELMIKGIAPTK